jgi:hypothetical protein
MSSIAEQIKDLECQMSTLTFVMNTLTMKMEELKKKEKEEQKQKQEKEARCMFLIRRLPQSIKEIVLDFNGVLEEETRSKFSHVEPLIITEKYLRDIKQKQLELPVLLEFTFYHTSTYPGNFDVFQGERHIMNVHVDRHHIKHGWGYPMRHYDHEWKDLDDFIQFLIRHFINCEPIPRFDWMDY